MKKQTVNAVKLGIFVLTGLLLLIFSLYLLGTNKNFFGTQFELKAQFKDVNGLLVGNNVRFSGIDVGNVRSIVIVNDTVIEVTLNLDKKMKTYIRSNAVASLGTDGLIGNRVVNITPQSGNQPFVQGGETLPSRQEINTQEMLQTLHKTNENVARIAEEVWNTVHLVRTSAALSELLNDKSIPANLKASLINLHQTTENAELLMKNAIGTLKLATEGKGTLATLLTDSSLAISIKQAVQQVQTLENNANHLILHLNAVTNSIEKDIRNGPGTANTLLRDSLTAAHLRATMANLETGTAAFAQDMEALKSNFLFRRYFRKLEKKAAKAAVNKD